MATIDPVVVRDVSASGSQLLVTWTLPTNGDVGRPFRLDKYTFSSIQCTGTVTSLALQGSNEKDAPSNWTALRDSNQAALSAIAAAGFVSPIDKPLWIRPSLTTGTTVVVAALLHRQDLGAIG